MASKIYGCTGLTGGAAGAVDTIVYSVLNDGDIAIAVVSGTDTTYYYTYDSSSSAAESSPGVIKPDLAGAGAGRWILTSLGADDITVVDDVSVGGDLTVTGGVDITGALTFDGAGVSLAGIKDEDDMVSDSATHIPTQQSVKAYVDGLVTGLTVSYDFVAGLHIGGKTPYKDGDEIYIDPGRWHHAGTTEQIVKWDSQLTFQLGPGGSNAGSSAIGTSCWQYIYIDDSAVVSLGSATLTATQFINSTTAPTWSASELGWYSGNDRCIFALYVGSGGTIDQYRIMPGNQVVWAQYINLAHSFSSSWKDQTMRVPSLATNLGAIVSLYASGASNYGHHYWRTNGDTAYHWAGWSYNSGGGDNRRDDTLWHGIVITDSSGIVEFEGGSVANASTNSYLYQHGYVLPEGM